MAVLSWIPWLSLVVPYLSIPEVGHFIHHLSRLLDGPGMFLVAVLDSSFLSIPEGNDLLIVGLSIGREWTRVAYYVAVTVAGSITGCLVLYTVGRRGSKSLMRMRIAPKTIERMQGLFAKYGILAVAIPAILPPPCPFKIFVLSAGIFRISPIRFLTAIALGRLVRYSTWGVLAYHYGVSVKVYMQNNLPTIGMVLLITLLAGITSVAIFAWYRRRVRRHPVSLTQP